MKHDDQACQWQVQKPVHEGASFSMATYEDEELHPCSGLQDVRETNDSEQNDGKDFNRSLHPLLRSFERDVVWVGTEPSESVALRERGSEASRALEARARRLARATEDVAPLVCAGTEAGELWAADERGVHCSEGGGSWGRVAQGTTRPRTYLHSAGIANDSVTVTPVLPTTALDPTPTP
jgi:hypothetical protein